MRVKEPGAASVLHSRRSSVRMSLQLAIPRQVGLHQSLPPLHQPRTSLAHQRQNKNKNPANGNLSKPELSHSRGSPHRFVNPPNSSPTPKPNKTNRKSRNKTRLTLPIILPQKRTIEDTGQNRIPWRRVRHRPSQTPCHFPKEDRPGQTALKRRKSGAKAHLTHPPTNLQHQLNQQHTRDFPAKYTPPPLFNETKMELARPRRLQALRPAPYQPQPTG